MKTGSKVEYISQHGDWYYVNAPSYGEGWCSSDYLSLLPQNPQRTTALGVDSGTSKMDVIFTPTHIVKSRLNLRRSASSKAMSIAVMEAGSKVHYMRESDGWYYVNAPSYGKGWCSSEYLSPLNQQYASVNWPLRFNQKNNNNYAVFWCDFASEDCRAWVKHWRCTSLEPFGQVFSRFKSDSDPSWLNVRRSIAGEDCAAVRFDHP